MTKRIVVLVGIFALMLAALPAYFLYNGSQALEAELALLRGEGMPLSFSELEAWAAEGPNASDSDNAVLRFLFDGPRDWPANPTSTIEPWLLFKMLNEQEDDSDDSTASDETVDIIVKELRAHRSLLDRAAYVAALPVVDGRVAMRHLLASDPYAPADFQNIPTAPIGRWLQDVIKLVLTDAAMALQDGEGDEAAASFQTAFALVGHYERLGRNLFTRAIADNLYAAATNTLLESLRLGRWTDAQLQALQDALPQHDPAARRQAYARGEVTFMLSLQSIQEGKHDEVSVGATDHDGAQTLAFQREFWEMLACPYPEARAWADALQDELDRRAGPFYYIDFARAPMKTTLVPALLAHTSSFWEAEARLAVARAAIAVAAYQLEHGTYPESLDDLDEAAITDPYSGEPLHYRPEGTDYRLYSVGPNYPEVTTERFSEVVFSIREGD